MKFKSMSLMQIVRHIVQVLAFIFFPRKLSVSPRTDRVLKYLKYVVFAGIAAISDGTYQGEGTGFRGTASVSVTVENGAIVDITVESYEDDQEFFVRAESRVISEILSAQSLKVQTVSGATFSSNGIIEAAANALNVTFENPNGDAPAHGGHGGNRMGEDGAFAEREQFGKRRHSICSSSAKAKMTACSAGVDFFP